MENENNKCVSAFSALEVNKSFLTIEMQDFINRAPFRRITFQYRCQKMSKENWVCTAAISFVLTILSTPLSGLHHKACPVPATTIVIGKAEFE